MQTSRARRTHSPSRKNVTRRAAAQAVEAMEARRMLAVSLDAAGWTKITPSSDTRTVYVSSSSGSDNNDGLTANAPVKSIAKGVSLLRSGSPDWLVLKRGDVFKEAFPDWNKSGRNSQEPMVITSYGDRNADRPWLKTGSTRGFASYSPLRNVAMIGLKFSAHTRDPNSPDYSTNAGAHGLHLVGPVDGFLVEDASFDHYVTNMSVQGFSGTAKNVQVRRSQFLDAYDMGVKAVGFYASMTDGLLLEGNLFDHNGWNEKISGAFATIYSHNIYLWQSNSNAVVRDNIIANAGSHGIQARGGGTIEGNLFVSNPIGALLGNGSEITPGGVTGRITGNVFIGSRDTNGMGRGWAIEAGNIRPGGGTVISDNVITQDAQNRHPAIKLETATAASNASSGVGVNDLTITRNILYKWYQAVSINSGFRIGGSGQTGLNDLAVTDNDFQVTSTAKFVHHPQGYNASEETWGNNRYYNNFSTSDWFHLAGATTSFDAWKNRVEPTAQRQQMQYPDPDRGLGTYNATLGGASTEAAFATRLRQQSKTSWDAQYSAGPAISYLRAGFTGVTPSQEALVVQPPVVEPPVVVHPPVVEPPPAVEPPPVVQPPPVVEPPPVVQPPPVVEPPVVEPPVVEPPVVEPPVVEPPVVEPPVVEPPIAEPPVVEPPVVEPRVVEPPVVEPPPTPTPPTPHSPGSDPAVPPADPIMPPPISSLQDTTSPQVLWSTFDPASQTVTMRFSEDVSTSLRTSSLRLKNLKTLALIPFSIMRMSYDQQTLTAVWTFTQRLPAADYNAIIVSPGLTDAAGNKLDGNGDGVWTRFDDYNMVIRASDMIGSDMITKSLVA